MNILHWSRLWNRILSNGSVIIGLVGRWVCGRLFGGLVSKWSVVGWSVGRWSVDLIKPVNTRLSVLVLVNLNLPLHLSSIFFQSFFSFAVSPLPGKCFLFLFCVRTSLNFKVPSHLILKWKITLIGKILKEFWGRCCFLSCQLKRSYWFVMQY